MRSRRDSAVPAYVETELKLALEEHLLDRVRNLSFLAERGRWEPRISLETTYFDTADRRLAQHGLTLRVRKLAPRRYRQTMKLAAAGGNPVAERLEWEIARSSAKPSLAAFGDNDLLVGIEVIDSDLRPVFRTELDRESCTIEVTGADGTTSIVDIALDHGWIEAGTRRLPIAEVELELRQGSAESLISVARGIREKIPVRLETLAKSSRGWMLARDNVPIWQKPQRPQLEPEVDIETALQVVLRQALAHWLAHEAIAADGREPEGVHQIRVAIRMLRTVLSLFAPLLSDATGLALKDRLRVVQQHFGAARDLDVLVTETLAPLRDNPDIGSDIRALDAMLLPTVEKAREDVRQKIDSRAYRDLVLDLLFWIELRGWREGASSEQLAALTRPAAEHIANILDRRWRKLLRLGKNLATCSAAERHDLRIALKKLRYGWKLFGTLLEENGDDRLANRMGRLQDALGRLNDTAVTRDLLLRLVASIETGPTSGSATLAAGVVIGWHAAHGDGMLEMALSEMRKLAKARPPWKGQRA